jgi:hypothetical protein
MSLNGIEKHFLNRNLIMAWYVLLMMLIEELPKKILPGMFNDVA